MLKQIPIVLLLFLSFNSIAQQRLDKLTVEKIMRDPKWMGTSPSRISWSQDGQYLYFNWNPDNAVADSIYFITLSDHKPVKASVWQKQNLLTADSVSWNDTRTAYTFAKDGDIFFTDVKSGKTKHVTQTTEREQAGVSDAMGGHHRRSGILERALCDLRRCWKEMRKAY